jgi:alpha-tubulin suppressor-like RCC1 family protein
VTVSVASGGGALSGTTELRTDPAGQAAFTDLALTGSVGVRTLRFSAQGLSAAISGAIAASAGPVSALTVHSGNNQTAPAGTAVPAAPAVRVADVSGNAIAGTAVVFAVTGGGGSITGANTESNAQGIATLGQWVLGTSIGPNTLTATVAGIAPITFTATGVIGPATNITLIEGNNQAGAIGAAMPIRPTVKVTDGSGNVITGLAVNFVPASGSGSVTGNPAITDTAGIARLGGWRLGLTPGVHSLNATREGATPVTFTATATDFPVNLITAGVGHSCAIASTGVAHCWGINTDGQLGNGTRVSESAPVSVVNGTGFTQIVAGTHTCALLVTGAARCWGNNSNGQLGDGTDVDRTIPTPSGSGVTYSQISAGFLHTCGIRFNDVVAVCWGAGGNGRLGSGGTASRFQPTPVSGGHAWQAISAGAAHSCGLRTDGVVMCWGQNPEGRIGDGTTGDKLDPVPVGSSTTFSAVAAGGGHTCALDTTGKAWCWGANTSGQLGDGTLAAKLLPVAVSGGRTYTTITTGTAHTCALTSDGTAWCWGENSTGGRVGDGTFVDRTVPTAIAGGVTYTHIRAGDQHTCARSSTGSAICWGVNTTGQLGDGTQTSVNRPAGVKRP